MREKKENTARNKTKTPYSATKGSGNKSSAITKTRGVGRELRKLETEPQTDAIREPEPTERESSLPVVLRGGAVDTEDVKSGRGGLQCLQGEYPASTASRRDMGILLFK